MPASGEKMATDILVLYETRNGSTAEVAEAIAARLSELGFSAQARPCRRAGDLSQAAGLVVGAPIYAGRWLSGAHRLLSRLGKVSSDARPPLAVFALGPRRDDPDAWITPREQFARALARHPDLEPVATGLFGGADPPKKRSRRDVRDWEAIRRWSDEVARLMRADATSQAGPSSEQVADEASVPAPAPGQTP